MLSEKNPPNFIEQLLSKAKRKPVSNEAICSLSYEKACCKGRGLVFDNKGTFARAKLCTCVIKCGACKGDMRLLKGGVMRSCRKPSPAYICNLVNSAMIPSRYTFAELSDFANKTGNCATIVNQIKNWEKKFSKNSERGLLMAGTIGVGKTFILAALAKDFLLRGYSVKFIDFFQLITQIKASYSDHKSELSVLQPLIDVDILIIDELGKGRNTDFELTILDQMIMGRYNQNKILIASTNYTLEPQEQQRNNFYQNIDLEREGDPKGSAFSPDSFGSLSPRIGKRIMSRLRETTFFLNLEGQDYREIKDKS